MDEQLKKRLLGAVVLLALAVLLIPVFFGPDSSPPDALDSKLAGDPPVKPPVAMDAPIVDLPPQEAAGTSMPEVPLTFEFEPELPVTPQVSPQVSPQETPVVKTEPQPKPKTPPEKSAKAEKPKAAEKAPEKAKALPEKTKALPEKTKAAPERLAKLSPPPTARTPAEASPKERAKPKAKAAPPDPALVSWAVQVGSFNDKIKADILRRELQVRRFPAFVMTARVEGKLMYRVRVGPELDRSKAERLRERLSRDMSLSGNVVGHP